MMIFWCSIGAVAWVTYITLVAFKIKRMPQ